MSTRPLWVFGYGSLIWNPGFEVAERAVATLPGYARRFCMRSIHHRGSEAEPGLVLALDEQENAACSGVAFRVSPGTEDATLAALRERELISSAYVERWPTLLLPDGRRIAALAYVIERDHPQYAGGLDLERQAQIIANATGGRGPNHEYLMRTAAHLRDLAVEDHEIEWLSRRVSDIRGGAGASD